MRWKVLISSAHMQSRLNDYRELLEQNNIDTDLITREQVVPEADPLPIVEKYDAIVCSDDEMTAKVIEKAKQFGQAGYKRIERKFSLEKSVEEYLDKFRTHLINR